MNSFRFRWTMLVTFYFIVFLEGINSKLLSSQQSTKNNNIQTQSIVRISSGETVNTNSRQSVGFFSKRHQGTSQGQDASIKCQDEDGQLVDWFVAYKLAKIAKSPDSNVKKGLGYSFLQPGFKQWKLSTKNINQSESIVGKTIDILFSKAVNNEDFLYLAYNDQPPDAPTIDNNGHTKGVIIANSKGGIFLQHSVPHFPQLISSSSTSPKYSYPSSGVHNGQIFFCLSLSPQQLDSTIGSILQITKPHVFKFNFPPSFNNLYSNLQKVLPKPKKRRGKAKRFNNAEEKISSSSSPTKTKLIQSTSFSDNTFNLQVGQLNLTVFAKSPKLNVEIYSDFIGPTLKTDLRVQSWLNGPHALPSNCSSKTLSVMNIQTKKIDGVEFSTSSDHSKWAVGGELKWTCIADLNRMQHQFVRGGAALCTQEENIWTSFQSSVEELMPCPKP